MERLRNFLYELNRRVDEHKVLTLSAALSFYTALSLSPLLIILIWMLGALGYRDQNLLVNQVIALVGPEAGKVLHMVLENTRDTLQLNSLAGVIGFLTLLLSAGTVFGQLQMSLNTIFEVPPPKEVDWSAWLHKRLLSIGMVFSLGFLAVVSLLANTVISYLATYLPEGRSLQIFEPLVSIFLFSLFFSLLFKILPDKNLDWMDTIRGGVLTALLFILGKSGIGLYLGQTSIGSAYGAAGSLIIWLVWVYYSSAAVLLGAEITAADSASAPWSPKNQNVLDAKDPANRSIAPVT